MYTNPPRNPFSGIIEVESFSISPDGLSWEVIEQFAPGEHSWDFQLTDNTQHTSGEKVFEGKLEGYSNGGYRVEFAWMPDRRLLYVDHILDFLFGYTDIYNETYRVEFGENGRMILICDEDGLPAFRWIIRTATT